MDFGDIPFWPNQTQLREVWHFVSQIRDQLAKATRYKRSQDSKKQDGIIRDGYPPASYPACEPLANAIGPHYF